VRTRLRGRLTEALPWLTGLGVSVHLLSLRLGLLDRFFYDAMHEDVQAIDYFSLPKAFLNLATGHSPYDTFATPAYGPHFTWYLAHPALAMLLGSWLSRLQPMSSYGLYTIFSLGLMAVCAFVLARQSKDALTRRLIWFLLLTAFPTYWMLFVGNVQALLVLALGVLFAGMFAPADTKRGGPMIFAGLLLSLLTKPVVLLMLPLLLLLKSTRRASTAAVSIYALISVLFETIPALNPQGIGIARVAWLATHPACVRNTMNIYTNHLQLTPEMRDNSIHWLNLIAQSGIRLQHVDIFSLPIFLDALFATRTPGWLYQLPVFAVLALSFAVVRLQDQRQRMEAALLLLMATSLVFFLSYPTVWEYQYTSILPVAASLLLLRQRSGSSAYTLPMFLLAACAWLPSLYVFVEDRPLTAATLTLIRLDRVLPVAALFTLMISAIVQTLMRNRLTVSSASAATTKQDYSSPVETPA
jgi:hypothetical protein